MMEVMELWPDFGGLNVAIDCICALTCVIGSRYVLYFSK